MAGVCRKRLIIGVVAALVIIGGALTYEVVIPARIGDGYLAAMNKSSVQLRTALKDVADSTTRPVFTTVTTEPRADIADIAIAETKIKAARQAVSEFTKTSDSLHALPLSGLFGGYKKAETVGAKADDLQKEVNARLGSYQKLVTYIGEMNEVAVKYGDELKSLSSVQAAVDLDSAITMFRDSAKQLRAIAKEYERVTPLAEFRQNQEGGIKAVRQLADAVDAFAAATENMDLDGSTSSVQAIVSLQEKFSDEDKEVQQLLSQDSSLIKPVVELPELVSRLGL